MKPNYQKIKRIAAEFRKGMLNTKLSKRWCFMVSLPLAGYLNFCGYPCKVVEGYVGKWGHCWITLPDGIIIDATADQFKNPNGESMPPVYIGEKPEWYHNLKASKENK